jgi:hypothetical protein
MEGLEVRRPMRILLTGHKGYIGVVLNSNVTGSWP